MVLLLVCISLREKLKENIRSVQRPLCFEYKANMYFLKQIQQIAVICFLCISQLFYAHVTFIMFAFQYLQNSSRRVVLFRKIYFENFFSFFHVLKVKLSRWNDILLLHSIRLKMRMKKGEIFERKFEWDGFERGFNRLHVVAENFSPARDWINKLNSLPWL